ncbi:40-residue YVTN family beta-propeller repeat-containing protein [Bradyrhizobium canariense]|uniref:40-residue YVTN family beta-propeller repeat-containing protein n=2 Tax=Bradyrhizobium canariense TaxID=255045 RepID=A0A1H1WVR0_9BRAD|nr:40-residue YVTN family beta-propeller repeat-containing protein [Bradyrhizobium canariense]
MSFDYRGKSDAKNNAAVHSWHGGSWIRCLARFSWECRLLGLCSVFCATLLPSLLTEAIAQPAEMSPLQLETKIALGDVRGRIDHMAVDLKRQRLFVAELGNDSVGVVDLANRKLLQTITGLKEPQGVGYEPSTDTLYVANAGDGSVRLFEGNEYKPNGQIELGSDADNVRVDPAANRILIAHGSGALAVIDPTTRSKVGDIPVKAHPEGFQIDHDIGQVFVNVPDAHGIAVVDRASQRQTGKWPIPDHDANFPMALDPVRRQVLVIFRAPAELGVFSMTGGKLIATAESCGDADDLFVDMKRGRVYVSCGAGFLDVFEAKGTTYRRIARIPTVSGARTSLLVPELDRLLVAVRTNAAEPAAIWMFRPIP